MLQLFEEKIPKKHIHFSSPVLIKTAEKFFSRFLISYLVSQGGVRNS